MNRRKVIQVFKVQNRTGAKRGKFCGSKLIVRRQCAWLNFTLISLLCFSNIIIERTRGDIISRDICFRGGMVSVKGPGLLFSAT